MTQYIDLSALVAEIERRIGELSAIDKASYEIGLYDAYKIVLSFIDTLEVKEVDFEKEINLYLMRNHIVNHKEESLNGYIKNVAKHFFELGLKAKGE